MRDAFVEEISEIAKKDKDLFFITGDLGFGVFEEFEKEFPKQYLNAGVAEQNMTMLAAGLAKEGKKVYTYSIGNFPTLRCLEQIRNDICYHDLNVTIVCVGGGFSYGQLGMSHHATEDLSILRAIPNMVVEVPSGADEVKKSVKRLYELGKPSYLRLEKSKISFSCEDYQIGKARLLQTGTDISFVSTGSILSEVLDACKKLQNDGFSCRIIDMHTIKPLDKEILKQASKDTKAIITVEENNVLGGLGGAVAECLLSFEHKPYFFKQIGLNDIFPSVVGDQNYLRKHYSISSEKIYLTAKEILQKMK